MTDGPLCETPVSAPRRRRRLRRLLLAGPPLLIAAVLGYYFYAGYAADRELAKVIAETDRTDPDWRLEQIEAKRKTYAPEDNAAETVLAAYRLLPPNWPATAAPLPSGSATLDARVGELPAEVQLDAALVRDLRAELARDGVKNALALTERLSHQTGGRYAVTWGADPLTANLPCQHARTVMALLRLQALLQDQDGQADDALTTVHRIVVAGRSVGDEPSTLSQLVRAAGHSFAVQAAERALAQGLPSAAALARAQTLLAEDAAEPLTLYAFRGERAFQHRLTEAIKSGEMTMDGTHPTTWRERAEQVYLSRAARRYHPYILRTLNRAVDIARLPPEEQVQPLGQLMDELDERVREQRGVEDVLAGLLIPALANVATTFRRDRANLLGAVAGLALERYRLEKGHWPDDLEELVPAYLSEVPRDPFDGRPLRYKRLADGVLVYSVGPDGQDDCGALNRKKSDAPGTDLGFRLWDAERRRQPPAELLPPPDEADP